MKSNKHIAWLVPGFADGENDTTCLTYLQAMLRTFKKEYPDIAITVFSFQYPFKKGWYKLFDTAIFSAGGKNKKGFTRFRTWKTILSEIKKVHDENPIDLFQSFWLTECAFIGNRVSKKYAVPHIAYIMGQDCLQKNNYLKILNLSKLKMVSVSDFANEHYFKSTGNRAGAVIPLGMDTDFYSVTENTQRTIDVIGAGSLIPLKQYDIFIEAIAEIKKYFPDIKCEICGEGVERENLMQRINEKNLSQNISLCGSLQRKDVLQKMNQSKIFLHTSSFESLGYIFQEALYCGCQLVALQTGLIPVTEQSHSVKSKEEIIECLRKLLSKKIVNQQQKVFTMSETVKALLEFYSKA